MSTSLVTYSPVSQQNIARATNLPASDSLAACCWVQIASYADFGEILTIEAGFANYLYLEYEAAGNVYLTSRWAPGGGGTDTQNLWTDARTSWNFVAIAADPVAGTGLIRSYFMTAGGVWTVGPALHATSSWTVADIGCAISTAFPTDLNGSQRYRAIKFWNASKTESQLRAEAYSVMPRSLTGLTFWNSGLVPGSLNIDQSGTGGNMILNGAPTASDNDPGIPWNVSGVS